MNRQTITKSKPTVIVGLDFGTTFSGFAYALVSGPERVHKFYEWPSLEVAGGQNYCKTPTSLLYNRVRRASGAHSYVFEDWAYGAFVKHAHNIQPKQKSGTSEDDSRRASSSSFITKFKLLLAGQESDTDVHREPADNTDIKLPIGLTVRMTISDYLRKLSELVLSDLKNYLGNYIAMDDMQWCLTVPAIWDEPAKQEMKACAEIAGLMQGPHCLDEEARAHPLIIVLEPEAASVYCQEKFPLSNGDQFLVVDVGGGTVDLVLHEKVGDMKVREVSPSSGGLYGGTYVDQRFLKFLSEKMKCFKNFTMQQPQSLLRIKGLWETVKHGFDGNDRFAYKLELPTKLARAWEKDESYRRIKDIDFSFDVVDLSLDDMKSIFDPVVDEILNLIQNKIIDGLKAIMVVGGFAGSPYLVKRIKLTFSERVETIFVPNDPGSAVCCGAVSYGVCGADLIVSRISKKTYETNICRPFVTGDPPHLKMPRPNGTPYCKDVFRVYVKNWHDIAMNECISHTFHPIFSDQTKSSIGLYSTSESDPIYVDDSGLRQLGNFEFKHPSESQLGVVPSFRVSFCFGRTTVEVTALRLNFGEGEAFGMAPVTFEKSSSYV